MRREDASRLFLSGIYIYPVKSLKGIALKEARVEERGLQHDRRWMLVDENYKFLSQRSHPRLARISVGLEASGL
ncbi:MAG: MOSC N-terminal beta barrel domain-containing protein [Pyrinomonadaceae bacterium]